MGHREQQATGNRIAMWSCREESWPLGLWWLAWQAALVPQYMAFSTPLSRQIQRSSVVSPEPRVHGFKSSSITYKHPAPLKRVPSLTNAQLPWSDAALFAYANARGCLCSECYHRRNLSLNLKDILVQIVTSQMSTTVCSLSPSFPRRKQKPSYACLVTERYHCCPIVINVVIISSDYTHFPLWLPLIITVRWMQTKSLIFSLSR